MQDDKEEQLCEDINHVFHADPKDEENVNRWLGRIQELMSLDIFDEKNHPEKVKLYLDSMALLKSYVK